MCVLHLSIYLAAAAILTVQVVEQSVSCRSG
jgi:hypothetical protein